MRIAYVDTSVLTAIAFDEPGAAAHAQRLDEFARLISSNLLEAELRAAFVRENLSFQESMLAGIEWILPSRTLAGEFATVLETGYLRGADLWHVATALYVSPPIWQPFVRHARRPAKRSCAGTRFSDSGRSEVAMSDRHLPTSFMKRTTEAAFETVIEAHLLENGYVPVAGEGFDCERAVFPETVLAFIRETQPKEWPNWKPCTGTRPESRYSATCASGWIPTARWRRSGTGSSATGANAPRGVLQGSAPTESGTRSPLRGESAGTDPSAPFLAVLGEIPRCHVEPERHSGGYFGTETSPHGPTS